MGIHAIIVIKNEKEEYLQYYDEIWKVEPDKFLSVLK